MTCVTRINAKAYPSISKLSTQSISHLGTVSFGKSDLISKSRVHKRFRDNLHAGIRESVFEWNGEKQRRGFNPVRCTAEGIERGLFVGKKEGGFMAAERFKVVALVAAVMCLCNADRVVMSVAVVPLAAKYGWTTSFLGIVQVPLSLFFILIYWINLSFI